jgi:hypothetical protein
VTKPWRSEFLTWSARNGLLGSGEFCINLIRRVSVSATGKPVYCSGTSAPIPMESSRYTKPGPTDEQRELERCREEISRLRELVLRLSEIVLRNVLKSAEQPNKK